MGLSRTNAPSRDAASSRRGVSDPLPPLTPAAQKTTLQSSGACPPAAPREPEELQADSGYQRGCPEQPACLCQGSFWGTAPRPSQDCSAELFELGVGEKMPHPTAPTVDFF